MKMSKILPTIAIATFLKNEYSDIPGWICWHFALGVKTLFIYDDHSNDGTWEILQAASKIFDVKIFQTNINAQPDFYLRQRDCFMAVAAACKGKYDWVGFLDGDEYIYIKNEENLPEFFGKFAHADGVAFSWRIHGSSNRVVRPKITTVEAFPAHSTSELGDNCLVKSFVRPEKMGTNYHTPHWFDVPTERYVRPNGHPVANQSPCQTIDWSDAFVMHYICRSMEHYVQRIKRRLNADLSDSQGYWNHFNRNDAEDIEPFRFLHKTKLLLSKLHDEMIKKFIEKIYWEHKAEKTKIYKNILLLEEGGLFEIKTFFGTKFYISRETNEIIHATEEDALFHKYIPVRGVIYPSTPHLITLYAHTEGKEGFFINGDSRVLNKYIYEIVEEKGNESYLRNPQNNLFIASLPNQGFVESNRNQASDWEKVSFIRVLNASGNEKEEKVPERKSVPALLDWVQTDLTVGGFLRMYYSMDRTERNKVEKWCPGLVWAFS